jgi:hypothetical protein
MRQVSRRWWFSFLSIGLVLVGCLTACASNPPNTGETTPPTLTWKVLNEDTKTIQTFTATPGTQYSVTLLVDDPGGVRQLTFDSASAWTCTASDAQQQHGPSDDVTYMENFSPDSQGNVQTHQFYVVLFTPDLAKFSCQSGWTLSNAMEGFSGTGTNFSNKKAQSGLDFLI